MLKFLVHNAKSLKGLTFVYSVLMYISFDVFLGYHVDLLEETLEHVSKCTRIFNMLFLWIFCAANFGVGKPDYMIDLSI